MQNQGIAQVERQGRSQPGFDVIRVVPCQDWRPGLMPFGLGRAESAAIGGNPGTFPGFNRRPEGRLGDAETVSY
jgi:hypothetical protein